MLGSPQRRRQPHPTSNPADPAQHRLQFRLGKSLTTPPATSTASRGSSVQVNFKLTVGSTTLSTLGAVKAIDYRTVDCKRWTSQNPWATAQPAPGTALSYVHCTTSYNLVWKTPKVTGCYELRITLADNLENFARIKLT